MQPWKFYFLLFFFFQQQKQLQYETDPATQITLISHVSSNGQIIIRDENNLDSTPLKANYQPYLDNPASGDQIRPSFFLENEKDEKGSGDATKNIPEEEQSVISEENNANVVYKPDGCSINGQVKFSSKKEDNDKSSNCDDENSVAKECLSRNGFDRKPSLNIIRPLKRKDSLV